MDQPSSTSKYISILFSALFFFAVFWVLVQIILRWLHQTVAGIALIIFIGLLAVALFYNLFMAQPLRHAVKYNRYLSFIIQVLLYLPCWISGVFNAVGKWLVGQYHATTMGSILMLLVAIGLLLLYLSLPRIANAVYRQGGKQLIDQPVSTDVQQSLGTYETLNGNDTYDYQYALSFWVFLDSAGPNTGTAYTKYTSLLNYANKPNIVYKADTHHLMVTMQQKELEQETTDPLMEFDPEKNRILWETYNAPLQKWNNVILNYNGGTMDIFLNGALVSSSIGVVPYYTLDSLTIGEESGIKGGMCNVVYFKKALTSSDVYYLYTMVKDKNPPVIEKSRF
jgi:hypothetical protein